MNHSRFAFFGAFINYFLLCCLLGNSYVIFLVSSCSLIFAVIFGQAMEKSSGLSRPFGYFGCVAGGILGSIIASCIFQMSVISILAAFSLVSPWIQVIGRLRCVVQGCCHGRTTTNTFIGITVNNRKSRVCFLSKLQNVPIHITPAYSIGANIIIGMFLWRVWYSDVCLCLIISLYFILTGLARFVEEAYRGEVQTPIYCQHKVYQWTSIVFLLLGILISTIPCENTARLTFCFHTIYLTPSIIFACMTTFAMGIDLPDSNMKYARLSD
jgi:prolipoprotein diacylglyceryltransferase